MIVTKEGVSEMNCNCSTCPHNIRTVNRKGYKKCEISDWVLDKDFDLITHMEKVGCLSHPQARECLMAPVIAELELKLKNGSYSGNYPMMSIYEALALIKGVK